MRQCSPPTTCHMSCVKCHMSHVTCHVSHVMCHMSCVTFHIFFLLLFFCFSLQSGEAYRWRVCYQRGLPRLVSVLVFLPLQIKKESKGRVKKKANYPLLVDKSLCFVLNIYCWVANIICLFILTISDY